ncbi:MAG: SDR family NAD(P)-dependent oxidoreductase [Hyphomonadaceae bacterium]
MSELLDLAGRVALITGAGQNVGRGIALTFAAHGARVVVNDFYLDRAEAVASEIIEAGGRAIALQADVGDLASVQAMAQQAVEQFGHIDILINNAGNGGPSPSSDVMKPYWQTTPAVWNEVLGVNLYGPLNCTSAVIPLMIENGGGRIITIISEAARVGEVGLEVYSAAKAGAAGLTRALARALGRHNILANNIAIAAMRASGVGRRMEEDEALAKSVLSKYVVRRLGEPSDIAGMALFLASDASGWITGQTFAVNGGFSFSL